MQRTTWRNEGTPFGSIGLQGATWIWLPGTGTDTAYKGQCVSGACYHGKPFFLMTCTVYKSLLHLNLSIELSQYVQPPILHGSNESESTTLPPTQFINPFIHMHWWQPLVTANTTFHAGPVCQGMTTSQQHHGQHQQALSSGPSRNRHNQGFRQMVPLYINQFTHESSGMVFYDSSTGVDLGNAQINSNNPGKGKVWRTLSKNLFMADCNIP